MRVVEAPIRFERQETNRFRFWRAIPELEGKFLRVITLEDKASSDGYPSTRRRQPRSCCRRLCPASKRVRPSLGSSIFRNSGGASGSCRLP